ncbi:MAG: pantetheine-phosphate adenylyltransferase [Candidatus Levybacteria bacterium]|nr:pantetheine-phosphate adenylyltransferase [Candidatus Levybacteria bacterium]
MYQYDFVVSGGTFDYFHKGHEDFLRYQFRISRHVLIGLTSDGYAQRKDKRIQSYIQRKEALEAFLKKEKVTKRISLLPINSAMLPSEWEKQSIDAIVVTPETADGAKKINEVRISKGLSPFSIVQFPFTLASDGKPITSSRIRNGEMDREGNVYLPKDTFTKTFILPKNLRGELGKPFVPVTEDFALWKKGQKNPPADIITVGDITTMAYNRAFGNQKLSIVDLRVGRRKLFRSLSEHTFPKQIRIKKVSNPPGTITSQMLKEIQFTLQNKAYRFVICVEGEEDLAVLPAILIAPLGYTILYGQPDEGIVAVSVTENAKKRAQKIFQQFITR